MSKEHVPVLLRETLSALDIKRSGVYIDGTFGRGGHTRAILAALDANGRIFAFDRDPAAEEAARALAQTDKRFLFFHQCFSSLVETLNARDITEIDGVLLDLGISSPQIDVAARGFSFRQDGPLDMRMDPTQGENAASFLARATQQQITEVLKRYGEERFAPSIARAIIAAREKRPIERTSQLAKIVAESLGTRVRKDWRQDPATRTFQALRIKVNRELDEVKQILPSIVPLMKPGARLVVISFHSLEDRLVKQFIAAASQPFAGDTELRRLPVREKHLPTPLLKKVGKAVKAGAEEIAANARARSAVLRVAERTTTPYEMAAMRCIMRAAFWEYQEMA
jgi:16S rRNA (cytosine1402-N4)-methyltransferase